MRAAADIVADLLASVQAAERGQPVVTGSVATVEAASALATALVRRERPLDRRVLDALSLRLSMSKGLQDRYALDWRPLAPSSPASSEVHLLVAAICVAYPRDEREVALKYLNTAFRALDMSTNATDASARDDLRQLAEERLRELTKD